MSNGVQLMAKILSITGAIAENTRISISKLQLSKCVFDAKICSFSSTKAIQQTLRSGCLIYRLKKQRQCAEVRDMGMCCFN